MHGSRAASPHICLVGCSDSESRDNQNDHDMHSNHHDRSDNKRNYDVNDRIHERLVMAGPSWYANRCDYHNEVHCDYHAQYAGYDEYDSYGICDYHGHYDCNMNNTR